MNYSSIIKKVRQSKFNERAEIYDFWGNIKESKILPLYYNNPSSLKLCFPEEYYVEKDVKEVEKLIKREIKTNNYPLTTILEPHYIGGLHSSGWCIRIKKVKKGVE